MEWPPAIRPVRVGGLSVRLEARAAVVTVLVVVVAIAVGLYSVTIGSTSLGVSDLVMALRGEADDGTTRILLEWRLPRVVFALLAGAALAVGAQSFSR